MTINQIRLFQLLSLPFIIASQKYYLLYYWVAMYLSLEFLNSRQEYRGQTHYKLYNVLFIAFQMLFCIDRLRTTPYKLSEWIEWQMNSVEHILFAFIICFKMVQYFNLNVFGKIALKKQTILIFIGFNVLGILSEIFQNSLQANYSIVFWEGSLTLYPDTIKDLQMNLLGSTLFILSMSYLNRIKSLR